MELKYTFESTKLYKRGEEGYIEGVYCVERGESMGVERKWG